MVNHIKQTKKLIEVLRTLTPLQPKFVYDASIQQWRFRTKADDDYTKAIMKELGYETN